MCCISFGDQQATKGIILVASPFGLLAVEYGSDVLQGIVHEVEMLFYFHFILRQDVIINMRVGVGSVGSHR